MSIHSPFLGYAVRRCRGLVRNCLVSTAMAAMAAMLPLSVQAGGKIQITDDSWVSLGAGLRTTFTSIEDGAPNGSDRKNDFDIANIRLYIDAQLNDWIGLTFNTDDIQTDGEDNSVDVLDLIARFEMSDTFNVWVGRMLTPADRIEMNGPFYGVSWNQYNLPLYPSDQLGQAGLYGRDDGITVWGEYNKFQYAAGVFDGLEGFSNQDDDLLYAIRLAYNFLAMEDNPGYYTSGTYYGGLGNVFTIGLSAQSQDGGTGDTLTSGDFTAYAVDLLSETVLGGGGVITVEAEYKDFDADFTGGTVPATTTEDNPCFCLFDGDAYYITGAYMFPDAVGPGKFQPYIRYVESSPSDGADSDITELGLNYIIKGHNARLNLNFQTGDGNVTGYQGSDTDVIQFGVQLQI